MFVKGIKYVISVQISLVVTQIQGIEKGNLEVPNL